MKLRDFARLITGGTKVVIEDESDEIYEVYVGTDIEDCEHLSREIIEISSGYYQIDILIR